MCQQAELIIIDASVPDHVLREIVDFYNQNFDQPHSLRVTSRHYRSVEETPINLLARSEGKVVGLLESRLHNGKANTRLLVTLLVHSGHRGRGLARRLFLGLLKHMAQSAESSYDLIVRFRESKRSELEPLYGVFGFADTQEAGIYPRTREPRWAMIRRPSDHDQMAEGTGSQRKCGSGCECRACRCTTSVRRPRFQPHTLHMLDLEPYLFQTKVILGEPSGLKPYVRSDRPYRSAVPYSELPCLPFPNVFRLGTVPRRDVQRTDRPLSVRPE